MQDVFSNCVSCGRVKREYQRNISFLLGQPNFASFPVNVFKFEIHNIAAAQACAVCKHHNGIVSLSLDTLCINFMQNFLCFFIGVSHINMSAFGRGADHGCGEIWQFRVNLCNKVSKRAQCYGDVQIPRGTCSAVLLIQFVT